MTSKDIDKLVSAIGSVLGTPQTKRVINFRNNKQERDFEVLDYRSRAEQLGYESDMTPIGTAKPETTAQIQARILYASGSIDYITYARMIGIETTGYDSDFENDDKNFSQSQFASYEEDIQADIDSVSVSKNTDGGSGGASQEASPQIDSDSAATTSAARGGASVTDSQESAKDSK